MLGGRHPSTAAGSAFRWLLAIVAAAVLLAVIGWIARQTPDAGTTAWLWQRPALLLGLAGCLVIARPGRWASLGR